MEPAKIAGQRIAFIRILTMLVLGISAFYHDSAAALIKDGVVITAAEEERFSRVKHDNGFPSRAIAFCLSHARISIDDIDAVAYYEKPLLKFERILETFVETYPYSLRPFLSGIPEWLSEKLGVEAAIRKLGFKGQLYFIPHHLSHASFAYFPSGFEKAAILTVDGVGEYETTVLWKAEGVKIEKIASIDFPHSLGLLYSTLTAYLGFRVNDDEYKIMGLAAYGTPRYLDMLSRVLRIGEDGSFQLAMEYFSYRESQRMWSSALEELLGPARSRNDEITERHRDIAASLQALLEKAYFNMLIHAHVATGLTDICLAGGVALNATANGKIFSQTPFKRAFIPGAAGDDGAAAGAALYAYYTFSGTEKRSEMESLSLGSAYEDEVIEKELAARKLPYETCISDDVLTEKTATLLAKGNIIGWFQGRMEFGPRALGNRSIIADPRDASMRERMNQLKDRYEFQPFAGSILEEHAAEYFEMPPDMRSPFMTFCFRARADTAEKLRAIIHKDGTCRIQTVSREEGIWRRLIEKFEKISGVPCILNTSFNGKGEPIVENPSHAIEDFLALPIDCLVIGHYIVTKKVHRC